MAIHHYQSKDGIVGYAAGDILIDTETGETSRAIADGRGVTLEPTLADLPFAEARDVGVIGPRLHPIDVGWSLRAERTPVRLEPGATLRVSYADRHDDRRVVSGPRTQVVAHLRAAGYTIADDDAR